MRDLVDGITEYDPQLLVDHDLDASVYTGNARFSQGFFDLAAKLGHPVTLMIQETYSTRSQEPYEAGVFDCQFAEQRARQVGFTGPIDYVASDGSGGDSWDASAYGHGISDTATQGIVGYGANGVLDSFTAGLMMGRGAHLVVLGTDGLAGRHVPETWPGGTNLIGQVVGPSPIPATDLNHVHADYTPNPAPSVPVEEDEMFYRIVTAKDATTPWYLTWLHPLLGHRVKRALDPAEANWWKVEAVYTPMPDLYAEGLAPHLWQMATIAALPDAPAIGGGGSAPPAEYELTVTGPVTLTGVGKPV